MLYKWLIISGIISIILTGCKTISTEPVRLTSLPTSEYHLSESNKSASLESQTEITSPSPTDEYTEEATKAINLQDELLLYDWKLGLPFSEVIDKLPKDAELDNSYMQYRFTTRHLDLAFTWGGILFYVFTDEPGKGLNITLNVGDDAQRIEEVLGRAVEQSTTPDGYLVYTYSFEIYDLFIYTKNYAIQGMAMQLTGRPTVDETEIIAKYYSDYIAVKYPKTAEPSGQDKTADAAIAVKYSSSRELLELREDFLKRYKSLVEVISGDNSNSDKINAIFEDSDFLQIEIDLETAASFWSSEDEPLGQLVTTFVEAVLDVYQWTIIRNNAEDNESRTHAAYQMRDATVRVQNANQMILIMGQGR